MLEACNNNLEMAVTMFLDGGGIAEEPSTSSAAVSAVRPHPEYVRGNTAVQTSPSYKCHSGKHNKSGNCRFALTAIHAALILLNGWLQRCSGCSGV